MSDGTILLVDDNPDDVELTLHAFRINRMPNPIVALQDGRQAIEHLLNEENPLPDLVLLDINLPRISGLQVIEEIRRHGRTRLLPVVMLTTSRHERDITRSYAAGVNSYIVKPLDFTEFSDVIRQIGTYWLTLNQHAPHQEEGANVPAVTSADR